MHRQYAPFKYIIFVSYFRKEEEFGGIRAGFGGILWVHLQFGL
jgi:hypothetical protein